MRQALIDGSNPDAADLNGRGVESLPRGRPAPPGILAALPRLREVGPLRQGAAWAGQVPWSPALHALWPPPFQQVEPSRCRLPRH